MDIIFYSMLLFFFVIFSFDIIPVFITWTQRIKIGRFNDIHGWRNKISKRGIKWLSETPKIKVTDQTRLILIDKLKGNYTKDAIQHWQEASLILGFSEIDDYRNDTVQEKAILKFLNEKFNKNGTWKKSPKFVDAAILSYAVMKIEWLDIDKYKPAFNETKDLILSHRGKDGTVAYRKSMYEYRYVDTIGFICPFLIKYGIKYDSEECVELAINQLEMFSTYGMSNEHRLPFHVYRIDNKAPLGLMGWGRGLGWYAIGLMDSWDELPESHPQKQILEELIVSFAKESIKYQNENGSWNWTITRKEARADSSATATLGWFMSKAALIVRIRKECSLSAENAIAYLMQATRKNGAIDFSQGDTKDIGVYSSNFDILPFTQGFAIRLINNFNKNILIRSE